VDDLIVAGNDSDEIKSVKCLLDSKFKIKNLGSLKYFLGLEIARSHLGISISQRKYALELIESASLLAGKPAPTPMVKGILKEALTDDLYEDVAGYRRIIGRLLYLTTTRPDIQYAVQQLSQYLHKPKKKHYFAAIRILRYLKNNPGQGIFYLSNSVLNLTAYSDSDWLPVKKLVALLLVFAFF
jgi:hypothetical protein